MFASLNREKRPFLMTAPNLPLHHEYRFVYPTFLPIASDHLEWQDLSEQINRLNEDGYALARPIRYMSKGAEIFINGYPQMKIDHGEQKIWLLVFACLNVYFLPLYQLFEVGKSLQQTAKRTVAFSFPYPI